jgi:hypothetical protein
MLPALILAAAFYGDRPYPYTAPSRPLLSTVTLGGMCSGSCRDGALIIGAGEIVGRRDDGALLVLTARHVVEKLPHPRVYVRAGELPGTPFAALWERRPGRAGTVVAVSPDADLALVAFRPRRIDAYRIATLADESWPEGGEVVGHPNGALWTTSPFRFLESARDTFDVDCGTCGPGDSGGGVFDGEGRLAGILVRQRIDPGAGADGRARGTTEFQVVSLAKVRAFIASGQDAFDPWSRF